MRDLRSKYHLWAAPPTFPAQLSIKRGPSLLETDKGCMGREMLDDDVNFMKSEE